MIDRTQIPDTMIDAIIGLYKMLVRSNPLTEMEREWREDMKRYVRHEITSLPVEKFMELPEEMRDFALERPLYELENGSTTDDTEHEQGKRVDSFRR